MFASRPRSSFSAADIAIDTVTEYLRTDNLRILLVGFDEQMSEIYRERLQRYP
tara:strand:+ start:5367 stop:5525 length:159 start_codon:yes stop_codon:yes gene_type:complete